MFARAAVLTLTAVVEAFCACGALGCASSNVVPAAPASTAMAGLPAVPLQTLHGERQPLDDLRQGRVAVVTLWATWCEACKQELPALERLNARLPGQKATLIAIAVGESPATVAPFVTSHALPWLQLIDEDFRFADALGQRRVPTTLVLDADGRVRYAGGALGPDALAALRKSLEAAAGPAYGLPARSP